MAQVRSLIGTPLRGELTLPESKIPAALSKPSSIGPSLDNLQGLLSQVLRLSSTASAGARPPRILIEGKDARDEEADKATAPWSWTAAEASSTESSLFPFLVHLAVARDDPEGLGAGWVRLVHDALRERGDARPILNRGISGDRAIDLAHRWQQDAIEPDPELLTVYVILLDRHT